MSQHAETLDWEGAIISVFVFVVALGIIALLSTFTPIPFWPMVAGACSVLSAYWILVVGLDALFAWFGGDRG